MSLPPPRPGPPPLRPGVRRAVRVIGSLLAVVVLAWTTLDSVVSRVAHGEAVVRTRLSGAGVVAVEVSSRAGAVDVVGTDGDDVLVTARTSRGLRAPSHGVARRDDRVVVHGDCPELLAAHCSVALLVEVPRHLDVVVRGRGDVAVRGTAGSVDARARHGDLRVDDVSGRLHLRGEHGRVDAFDVRSVEADVGARHGDVRLSFGVAPTTVVATSDHGSVELVVPPGPDSYRLEARSDHGHVDGRIRTDPAGDRHLQVRAQHGDVTVRYPGT